MENISEKFSEKEKIGDLDELRIEYVELYEQYKKLKVSVEHDPNSKFLKNLYFEITDNLQINILKRGYIEQLIKEGMLWKPL